MVFITAHSIATLTGIAVDTQSLAAMGIFPAKEVDGDPLFDQAAAFAALGYTPPAAASGQSLHAIPGGSR